jgi:hypothetical protein
MAICIARQVSLGKVNAIVQLAVAFSSAVARATALPVTGGMSSGARFDSAVEAKLPMASTINVARRY